MLAALLGAIVWNLLTWWIGLPSSSTHALIGGLVGAALVQSGSSGVQWHGIVEKVVIPGALSPVVGFAGAFVLMVLIYRSSSARRRALPTADFATGSSSPEPGSRSRTARTTRRRRWA